MVICIVHFRKFRVFVVIKNNWNILFEWEIIELGNSVLSQKSTREIYAKYPHISKCLKSISETSKYRYISPKISEDLWKSLKVSEN